MHDDAFADANLLTILAVHILVESIDSVHHFPESICWCLVLYMQLAVGNFLPLLNICGFY